MKVVLENIGVIRYAEVCLKSLTVLCGLNNSGKTYVTYALYGFLSFWEHDFEIHIEKKTMQILKETGVCTIDLCDYQNICNMQKIVDDACLEYRSKLPQIFAARYNKFNDAKFDVLIESNENVPANFGYEYGVKASSAKHEVLRIKKARDEAELIITLFPESETETLPDYIIKRSISDAIKATVFKAVFPSVFFASTERTGVVIFRGELNFARNRLLELMSDKDLKINPFDLIGKSVSDYALPVNDNVDYVRNLEFLTNKDSYLAKHHPDILEKFDCLFGGSYQVSRDGGLYFVPSRKNVRISMDESSSSVRSLLLIGFYLRHIARKGDLFMIDEPELNLHPENQRKMACLLASLVNCGVRVFITTHSDYIVREFSNLILLNGDSQHLEQIISEHGYSKHELLSASDVKVFVAEKGSKRLPGKSRNANVQTLVEQKIDDEQGIGSSCFDDTIDKMNSITDAIIYGGL